MSRKIGNKDVSGYGDREFIIMENDVFVFILFQGLKGLFCL